MPTRDATLGEPFLDADQTELVALHAVTGNGMEGKFATSLIQPDRSQVRAIWSAEYRCPEKSGQTYLAMVQQIEADSRTGIAEALREVGYGTGSDHPGQHAERAKESAEKAIPDRVEGFLSVMNFVPQFAAVRWAHGANREQGESSESLSVLVRGYAHLAMLSESYWNSMSRVYKARALLYAERMVVAYPDSSEALWHRAYARAIVGLHGAALTELEEIATRFGEAELLDEGLPGCMRLIEPYCRFDGEKLLAVGNEDEAQLPLSHFLNFRVAEAVNDSRLLSATCQEALEYCPDAYEIYGSLCRSAPLGVTRWAARAAPAAMDSHLPLRLKAIDGLPESVQSLLMQEQSDSSFKAFVSTGGGLSSTSNQVAAALIIAGRVGEDSAEPSWAVLGRMIQEVNYLNCLQLLQNARNAVEFSLADLVEELMPLVEGHPYAGYVESFRVLPSQQPNEFAEVLKDTRFVDPQFHMSRSIRDIWNVKTQTADRLGWELATTCQRDLTAKSLTDGQRRYGWYTSPDWLNQTIARELEQVSPHCPETLRTTIELAQEPTEEQLLEWERKAKAFPDSLCTIGQIHLNERRYDAAVRCFERSVAVSPSADGYLTLAWAYDAQGKPELWQPTVERYLDIEDHGMGHAWIHSAIAHRMMDEKEWEEAKPHALIAAETCSGWGMSCAARCFEGLEDWDRSESWTRRLSESYGERSRMEWYYWCRRNRRGDLDAARQLVLETVRSPYTVSTSSGLASNGVYHLLEGNPREAADSFLASFHSEPDMIMCSRVLVMAAEFEDMPRQQSMRRWLEEFSATLGGPTTDPVSRFLQILEASSRPEAPQKPDVEAMSKVMKDSDFRSRVNFGYIFGRLLELHGDQENAKDFYLQAVEAKPFGMNSYTLAAHALAELSE